MPCGRRVVLRRAGHADPIPSFTSQAEQASGQNFGLVAQIAIGQNGFKITPMAIKIKPGVTFSRIFQRIDQVDKSVRLDR